MHHSWDLWALAVMTYEMLTGFYPFEDGAYEDRLAAVNEQIRHKDCCQNWHCRYKRPACQRVLQASTNVRISLHCYDSAMGNLLVLFTIERLSYDQALHALSHACKLLIAKEMVGGEWI